MLLSDREYLQQQSDCLNDHENNEYSEVRIQGDGV